ncbi:MAG: zinc ribbon domain-containing protein [Deltaproteobacteria bacterium]|nr:zinc ribbon domain-containing protein [Deltaproteobacteria bacterium]
MPTYEFECTHCGHRFEAVRRISECSEELSCERCGKPAERVFSAFAVAGTTRSSMSTAVRRGGGGCDSSGGG